jgi:hypothetical protein
MNTPVRLVFDEVAPAVQRSLRDRAEKADAGGGDHDTQPVTGIATATAVATASSLVTSHSAYRTLALPSACSVAEAARSRSTLRPAMVTVAWRGPEAAAARTPARYRCRRRSPAQGVPTVDGQ